jgi:hypothetical protein
MFAHWPLNDKRLFYPNEKITRKKKAFQLINILFIYFSLDPSYFQTLFILNNLHDIGAPLEVLQIILNFNSNRTTYKEFFECLEPGFVLFGDFFF